MWLGSEFFGIALVMMSPDYSNGYTACLLAIAQAHALAIHCIHQYWMLSPLLLLHSLPRIARQIKHKGKMRLKAMPCCLGDAVQPDCQ